MRCQEVVGVSDKETYRLLKVSHKSSEVKQYEETIANEESQNVRGGIKSIKGVSR